MTINLLTTRLKDVKRELTALKTAHRRGLGLLRVYKEQVYIGSTSSAYDAYITVNFTPDASPYPFVSIIGYYDSRGQYASSIDIYETRYTNNGMSAVFYCGVMSGAYWPDTFNVISTAPIQSINIEEIN